MRPPWAVIETAARLRAQRPLSLRVLAVAAPLLGACLCLLASLPLRAENAHPVAKSASLVDMTQRWEVRGVELPSPDGPDELVGAPQLVIHRDLKATLDGQDLGAGPAALVELENMAKRKRELWRSFHPAKPFAGVMVLSADRRMTTAQLEPFLRAAVRAGYTTLQLHCDRVHEFAHPPLGVWRSIHRNSAATIKLGGSEARPEAAVALALGGSSDYAALAAAAVALRHEGEDVWLSW